MATQAVVQELQEKVKALEKAQSSTSVDAVLASVRRYLDRPLHLFDPADALVQISHLCIIARNAAHEKTSEFQAILRELEQRKDSLTAEAFHNISVALLGDPVRAKIAKQITGILKSQARTTDPSTEAHTLASSPTRTYTTPRPSPYQPPPPSSQPGAMFQLWSFRSFCSRMSADSILQKPKPAAMTLLGIIYDS